MQAKRKANRELAELEKDQKHRDFAVDPQGQENAAPPPRPPQQHQQHQFSPPKHQEGPSDNDPVQEAHPQRRTRVFSESGYSSQASSPTTSPSKGFHAGQAGLRRRQPRKSITLNLLEEIKSERSSVVTDEDASAANDINAGMSDREEDSESSDEGEGDQAVTSGIPGSSGKTMKSDADADADASVDEPAQIVDEPEDVQGDLNHDKSQQTIGVTGIEPEFKNNMIRQRVTPHGIIREMEPETEVAALQMPRHYVGRVSPEGPIKRWLERRKEWDRRYLRDHLHWRKIKLKDRRMAAKAGYLSRELSEENPPLSAVAGMYSEELAWQAVRCQDSSTGLDENREHASLGLLLWSQLSSKPDAEQTGKRTIGEMARRGDMKLDRKPSSVKSPDIEKEMSFDQ